MNETTDSKKRMERDMTEAIRLHALSFAPHASSSFNFRVHDRVTLGHDVGDVGERPALRDRSQWCDIYIPFLSGSWIAY